MSNNPVSYIDPSGGEDKYGISVDPSNIGLSAKYSNYDDAFKELTWKMIMGELRQATVDRIYELGTKYYDKEIEKWIYNAQGYEVHLRSIDNRSLRRSYYTDGFEFEDGKFIHSPDMPKMGSKEWLESASGRVEQDYTIESFTIPIFGFLKNFKLASKGVEEVAQVVSGQAVKGGLTLEKSVANVMGKSYKAAGEVTVPIKNTELLNKLNVTSRGDWVKVYEAGLQNGSKMETHYFRNNTTGQVFDIKTKYNYWHQKSFKNLGQ